MIHGYDASLPCRRRVPRSRPFIEVEHGIGPEPCPRRQLGSRISAQVETREPPVLPLVGHGQRCRDAIQAVSDAPTGQGVATAIGRRERARIPEIRIYCGTEVVIAGLLVPSREDGEPAVHLNVEAPRKLRLRASAIEASISGRSAGNMLPPETKRPRTLSIANVRRLYVAVHDALRPWVPRCDIAPRGELGVDAVLRPRGIEVSHTHEHILANWDNRIRRHQRPVRSREERATEERCVALTAHPQIEAVRPLVIRDSDGAAQQRGGRIGQCLPLAEPEQHEHGRRESQCWAARQGRPTGRCARF